MKNNVRINEALVIQSSHNGSMGVSRFMDQAAQRVCDIAAENTPVGKSSNRPPGYGMSGRTKSSYRFSRWGGTRAHIHRRYISNTSPWFYWVEFGRNPSRKFESFYASGIRRFSHRGTAGWQGFRPLTRAWEKVSPEILYRQLEVLSRPRPLTGLVG